MIDQAEDQLTLPPGVSGADDAVYVGPVHEFAQNIKLVFGRTAHKILPPLGQDGQIGAVPAVKARIIRPGRGQLHQVAHAPAHKVAAAFQVAVTAFGDAQGLGYGLGHRGLFGYDQIGQSDSPFRICC